MAGMIQNRLTSLRERMRALDVDTFMITQPENRRYISGFTGSAGVVFITHDAQKLATDFRYYEQVKLQAPDFELIPLKGKFEQSLPHILSELGSRRIAFESDHVTYDAYQSYVSVLPAGMELVPTKEVVRELRAIKSAEEIEALKHAIAVSDQALEKVRRLLRPGMTEKEVAWRLEQEMRNAGAGAWTVDIIVAAGPAGAMAHACATDRPIQAGEPIVIDMGCRWNGYHSDMTRTLVIGEPDARFREIYEIVLRAQQKAEAEIMPGMSGKDAHALAADVIAEAGYAEMFGHGLGHGVGLAIHELPVLNPFSEHVLKPRMVFSVEPGIYLPGWGGVRIEDIAMLDEEKLIVLTQASKDPLVPWPEETTA